jgi:hypothetical protein
MSLWNKEITKGSKQPTIGIPNSWGFRCTWDFPSRTYWHRTVDHVHEALAYWLVHCREKDEQTQSYMEIYGISLSYIDLEEHGRTFHMSQASFGH